MKQRFCRNQSGDISTLPAPRRRASTLFQLGQIVATPALLRHFEQHQIDARDYLKLHVTGDFGDLNEEDKAENRLSIERGFRILSAYMIAGERVWIISEADRSATTLMFASEY